MIIYDAHKNDPSAHLHTQTCVSSFIKNIISNLTSPDREFTWNLLAALGDSLPKSPASIRQSSSVCASKNALVLLLLPLPRSGGGVVRVSARSLVWTATILKKVR